MSDPFVTVFYYQVIKWDKDKIIATELTGLCQTVTIQISFADKNISATHSIKMLDEKTKKLCRDFKADEREEEFFVLEGSKRWRNEHSSLPQKSEK